MCGILFYLGKNQESLKVLYINFVINFLLMLMFYYYYCYY